MLEHPVPSKPEEERDEFQNSLMPPVDSQAGKDLCDVVHTDHNAALEDRIEWENRLAQWEDAYHGRLPEKDFPWPGCANFNVPLTATGIDTYIPRLVEAVLGQEPPIQVVPVDSADETRRDRVETFLNWQARTELDLDTKVPESAHLFMSPGTVVSKQTWYVERRRRKYVREYAAGTTIDRILESLFGSQPLTDVKKKEGLKWTGVIKTGPKSGPGRDVTIELKLLEDGEIQVKVDEEFVIEKPRIDLIEPPDFIAPAKGGHDIQRLPWCQHRLWLTEQDLRDKVALGVFDKKVVEELLKESGDNPAGDDALQDAQKYREGLSITEGVEDQGASNVRADQFEIWEDYRFYDVDDDGNVEHVVSWHSKDYRKAPLGWDLVDNVYAHGKRPFAVGRFQSIPFRFLGLSFAEITHGIQDEINTMHDQRVDWGTVQNIPFFFYRASSTMPPTTAKLRPGEGIPVDNPKADVEFPRWQGSPAFGQAEEALLMQYWERRTGLSDISLGRQPNRVGATRTASGTATLLSEAGLRQKMALEAFQRFWIEIFEQVLMLNQEYLAPGKEFRVTGKLPEYVRIEDRTEIQGRFDIRLAPASQSMNRSVAREDATVILQALLNPALIQVGMVGIKGIKRAFSDLLRAFGRDPDLYLEPMSPPKQPEEELAIVISGGDIKPVNGEDHMLHIMHHEMVLNDPMARSVLKPQGVLKFQRHIGEHMQMQQAEQLAMALGQSEGPTVAGPQASQAEQGKAAPQPTQAGTGTNLPPTGAAGPGASPTGGM